MIKALVEMLREPAVRSIDVDDNDRIAVHASILENKRLLREVFTEFHHSFHSLDRRFLSAKGQRIEMGAGVSPVKRSYPDVLSSDIVASPDLDLVIDAGNMDLEDDSVRVLFGQNCFHHFPDPERFFHELARVLRPGGGAILLEPYYGPMASFLFKRLFTTEGYDKEYPSWVTPASGPMNGANQALSYIVFVRDRDIFERRFPELRIIHRETCGNYLKYLLSGGLNFRQLCPDWMSPAVSAMQWLLSPFNRWLALHHVVVIRKEPV